jgi:hypothetical protein
LGAGEGKGSGSSNINELFYDIISFYDAITFAVLQTLASNQYFHCTLRDNFKTRNTLRFEESDWHATILVQEQLVDAGATRPFPFPRPQEKEGKGVGDARLG